MEAIGLLVHARSTLRQGSRCRGILKSAQPLAQDEKATLKWYAIKLGPGKFGIFDTFAMRRAGIPLDWRNREGVDGTGKRIIAVPPQVQKFEVLATHP